MAVIKPFRAIRPAKGLEDKIAALPYDVYNRKEAREVTAQAPLSFLNIDRPETQFAEDVDMYSDPVYEKAAELLWGMEEKKEFIREEVPCYYIYELVWNGRAQDGMVACASVDDYVNGVIRRHENTRPEKEQDRIRHITACNAQTGPIFLAYRQQENLTALVASIKEEAPLYDFETEDGVTHRVWRICEEEQMEQITEAFAAMEHVYIADGHHRAASAVKVGLAKRETCPDYTGEEPFNYFLSVLFPDSQLQILDYNRVVRDLNGRSAEEFLEALKADFWIEKRERSVRPEKKGCFGMYLDGTWYALEYQNLAAAESEGSVDALDVSILQNQVLEPFLGIADPKTDRRIDFVGGIRGLKELEQRVNDGWAVAFSLYPTSMTELFAIADKGLLMPPKSTWFEPKLRSGLFVHEI